MWRPPERIKHALPDGDWPTAAEAASSRWFTPLRLGPVEIHERTWVPAMVPWRASEGGDVTPEVLAWYERFARGRPGAIVVEATGVRDVPSGPLLRIGDDRFISGLRELVEAVRRASGGRTRLFVQLIDFLSIRRRPDPAKYFERFLDITDRHRASLAGRASTDAEIRSVLASLDDATLERVLDARELEALRFGARERITDLHLEHVRELPRTLPATFARAAQRALEAGFDGVELHFAHAYTLASFLSALNTRQDGWGGTREGRVRLPLEVLRAVRARVAGAMAVGLRYLTDDCITGGSVVEDAEWFGVRFAEAGADYLSLSRGGKFEDARQPVIGEAAYPYTGPSGYECMPTVISDARGPFGRNVAAAARVRRAVRDAGFEAPVVVSGGICSFAQAEALIEGGSADVVAAARQSLADPDWFRKVRLGRGSEVRRCKYTNYCEALDQRHEVVTCQLWDRVELDAPGAPLSPDGKRRLVAPDWSE